MRFQVPQFIEVEDKIIGPFTLKQFIYLAGGAGLCTIIYLFLPLLIAIPLMVPVVALSGALAFYKVNNRPFITVMEAFFKYNVGNKLYIWKHRNPTATTQISKVSSAQTSVPKLSQSKLRDLSWKLDIHENEGSGPNSI